MEKIEKPLAAPPKNKPKQLTTPVPPPPLPPLPEKPPGGLVAKSPADSPSGGLSSTLQSRGSEETAQTRRDEGAMRVLTYGGLQMLCGLLLLVFGILTLVHRSAMGRYGAGLWGGGAAMGTGLAGVMAGLRGYYNPGVPLSTTGTTVYLALCLVSVAVTSLALVITSTGLLRDLQQPAVYVPEADEVLPATLDLDSPLTDWAPVLASVGLLLITLLLLVSLVAAVLRVYRLVCPCTRRPQHRLLESPASSQYATSKQGLVHSWLGQQTSTGPLLYPAPQPGLIVYPPPLLMEGSGLYTVPPSSVGYPQCISPLQPNPYTQRRRSPHPHRGRHSVTPEGTKRNRRPEKSRQKETLKEKEITDEQLEKTYTGLDREIAEEFISIAMTNPESSHRAQLRPSREDKVIDCIAPM